MQTNTVCPHGAVEIGFQSIPEYYRISPPDPKDSRRPDPLALRSTILRLTRRPFRRSAPLNTAELIGAVVGLGGLAMQGGFFAFMLGKHSNRLQTVERETADLKTKTDAHGVALAGIEGMMRLLDEVRGDVKKLLIGGGSRRQSGSN